VRELDFVLPDGVDDPLRPSGGNVYDRRVIDGLAALGWTVRERRIEELARIPDGALVVVDGLLTPEVDARHAARLRLVVLLHMPLDTAHERPLLSDATAVVATSRWTRQWLVDSYGMPGAYVVEPGAEIGALSPGTPSGGELLCVGAVTPTKGQDVLVEALAAIQDLEWRCVCVGSLDIAPDFVDSLGDELVFAGPLTGHDLEAAYAGADVLVSASRAETYGMVITEALAHGLPVIATEVGGVPESLGHADAGVLVPPEDASALADALRSWLTDADQRERLRAGARARRETLTDWRHTSRLLTDILAGIT
jgi:glycosyltransferase involved in cell wall biosynthesis